MEKGNKEKKIVLTSENSEEKLEDPRIVQIGINGGGWIPLSVGCFMLIAIFLPYIIAVSMGGINPWLPFISDAAGSPPQSGIFAIFLVLSAFVGVHGILLRYMMVHVLNYDHNKKVETLNKVSSFFGLVCLFGMIMVGGYPINFNRGQPGWLSEVAIPHFTGAVLLFGNGIVYAIMQCILTRFLMPQAKKLLIVRIAFLTVCCLSLICILSTIPRAINFLKVFSQDDNSVNGMDSLSTEVPVSTTENPYKLPSEYSSDYMVSSVSEWLLVIAFACYFFTFIPEARQYSFRMIIGRSETIGTEGEIKLNKDTDIGVQSVNCVQ